MAFDKVIDSSVLTSNLTQIANTIREKGGTTAALSFPDGFVDAISKIEAGGNSNVETHEITFASDITGSGNVTTLLTGNQFIKEHYAETNFFALMLPQNAVPQGAYRTLGICHGNKQLGSGVGASHGFILMLNSAGTAVANASINGAINGSTWNLGFRVASSGNLTLYTPANRNIAAGTYILCLGRGV